ncbi:hypothetical protein Tco_1343559 [Tanacetum coccineum]
MPSLNNIWSIVRRLVFSAPVYHTCSERKLRLFTNVSKEWDMLYNEIVANVRLKLSSLKVKQSVSVKEVVRLWNIECLRKCSPGTGKAIEACFLVGDGGAHQCFEVISMMSDRFLIWICFKLLMTVASATYTSSKTQRQLNNQITHIKAMMIKPKQK